MLAKKYSLNLSDLQSFYAFFAWLAPPMVEKWNIFIPDIALLRISEPIIPSYRPSPSIIHT
jgi:hypothetical protein